MNAKKCKQIRRVIREMERDSKEVRYIQKSGTITLAPACPRALYKRMKRAAI